MLNAGLKIDDIIPSAIAAARSCLTNKEEELGVLLVDIGSATTGMVVFEEGNLIDYEVFPIGSANITNDIALGLRTDIVTAERIKKEYARIFSKGKKPKKKSASDKIQIPDKSLVFSKRELRDIVESRVSDIFTEIQKVLKKKLSQKLLPGGIVLTGGGAKLPGLEDYARQNLKLPSRIGVPKGIEGLEEDPSLSVVAGLLRGKSGFMGWEAPEEADTGFFRKIGNIFRIFLP